MFGVQTILSTLVLAAVPSSQDATLLFATTPGCGPCRQVAPLIEELGRQGYSVETIDASQHPDIIRRLGVDRFPTFLMLSGDRVVDRVVGGGDPILLKPRILQMYRHAAEIRRKAAPASNTALTEAPPFVPATPEPPPTGIVGAEHFVQAGTPHSIVPAAYVAPSSIAPAVSPAFAPIDLSSAAAADPVDPRGRQDALLPWIMSSVKLRVDADNTHSWGTGTIIDTRNGEALILTCGHIFRDSQGRGKIEAHLYGRGSSAKVFGRCLFYDLEIDLALVAIRPPCPVRAVPLAPPEYPVRPEQTVLSVGCDGGADPTVRRHRIMSIDRIGTPPGNALPFQYIQVSGAPVSGRSGGGLFAEEGYLLGVCNTADPVENDGHFVPPHVIRQVLKRQQLAMVYENPSLEQPSTPAPAPTASAPAVPPMSSDSLIEQALRDGNPAFARFDALAASPMNEEERATLDEVQRRIQDGDEVIMIIRSRRNPAARSNIITLNAPSEQFMDVLTRRPEPSSPPEYDPVILSSQERTTPTSPLTPLLPASTAGPVAGQHPVSFPVFH